VSLDAEAEAFKTRLAAATKAPVYDFDEAAALTSTPANYTVISVEHRFGGEQRFDGTRDTNLRRLTTTVASKTITNARLLLDRIFAEFAYSEVAYESQDGPPKPDDGYFSAAVDWTY
jgi:hypothetical protein